MNKSSAATLSVRTRAIRVVVFCVVYSMGLGTVSCSKSTDEGQIRSVIDAVETAVEDRDMSDTMIWLAPDYRDGRGLDRNAMENFVRGYFLLHPKIELLVHVNEIKIDTATRARARIDFALVGTQQIGSGDTPSLTGETENLQVEFQRIDGNWRIQRVERADK